MTLVENKQESKPLSRWARFRAMTRDVRRGFIAEWTVTIILLLFATTTLVQAFVIPSSSMEDTLLIGDHVLVDKMLYAPSGGAPLPYRDVRRGDVIVFRYPLDISQNYVKRAIGVPGDHLKLVNGQLVLNGTPMDEPYVKRLEALPDDYRDNFPTQPTRPVAPRALEMLQKNVVNGELVVPPGSVFAMGDNRNNSEDSRYWGFVPRENIVGTPLIIYWSYETTTEALTNGNIGIDHIIDVIGNFFTKTRWSRTFHVIRPYPLGRRDGA
jgi:signal peptidase I